MSPEFWTDQLGVSRRVPTCRWRLKFYMAGHAALRAFVFARDGFVCLDCGDPAVNVPAQYTGRETVATARGSCLVMDHVVSRRNGGSHGPENLRTLCDSCNARKAGLVDAKSAKGAV